MLSLNFYAGRDSKFTRRTAQDMARKLRVAPRGEIAGISLFQMVSAVFLIVLIAVTIVPETFIVVAGQRDARDIGAHIR